jgi:signal transduction histidine kinase
LYINIATDLIVNEVTFLFDEVFYNTPPGILHPYFMIIFITLIIYAHFLVYREYRRRKNDKLFRQKTIYFFLATAIAYFGGTMNFLPVYGIEVPPITSTTVAIGSGIIAYAILRYRLFNTRIVTAQLLTFVLVAFTSIRLIVSDSAQLVIFNTILLGITLLVGLNLIKSVKREVEAREKIEKLAKDLAKANDRLKELDQLKTEFLSLASHQFRSPLAAMKGYASLILEGSYGKINPAVHDAVDNIFESADNLVSVVQDFLDVSRIEQGSMKYNFEKIDMKPLVDGVVDSLRPNINEVGLKIGFKAPDKNYFVNADKNKINQVIINLIDNAQKYTKEGSVDVELDKKDGMVLIKVIDTGIGIRNEDIENLFGKFSRNKEGEKINVGGTGLGLYIVKKIVEAHGGEIWVKSEGYGKGSVFIVGLEEV